MRKTCLNCVHELARKDERVYFVGSDLGAGVLNEFKEEIPERFFMEGIMEQAVVGMAAGMAMEGKIPYVNTITSFLTRRCYEQIVLDLCLHNLPVRLIGNGGGFVYAPLGPTHQTTEDIAITRVLPNMSVVAVADANEMKEMMEQTLDWPGPIYIRLAKGYDPIVTDGLPPFEMGKARQVQDGKDALVLTTGITLGLAREAAEVLAKEGINISILHLPTIKPLDTETILQYADNVPAIITVEEHSTTGGLGSAVAELLMESDMCGKKFKRLGVDDTFSKNYGSQKDIMSYYGLTTDNLCNQIRELEGK